MADAKHVLMIEDNRGDFRLVERAIAMTGSAAKMHLAENGVQALAYLAKRGQFKDAPRPDLILLDLNLPVIPGSRVLKIIKQDDQWREIPVFIVSSSERSDEVDACFNLGAEVYIIKPGLFDSYIALAETIVDYLTKGEPVTQSSMFKVVMK
jgi:two-component system, chemotaxis family, response regulator Rcp1